MTKPTRQAPATRAASMARLLGTTALMSLSMLATAQSAHAEPLGRYHMADGSRTDDLEKAASSWRTPEFLKDHAVAGVKAEYAYAYGYTGQGVTISAVDSGVLASHPQLQGQVEPLLVEGVYGADGDRYEGRDAGIWSWKQGETFSVPGVYDPAINDSHGTAASGEMVAKRDGLEMHGIAFDAKLLVANTGGTDSTLIGPMVDYNYFKEAYDVVARNGATVTNSSWGQGPSMMMNYDTVAGLAWNYSTFSDKKSFLDAAGETALKYGTIQVWANGNAGYNNPDVTGSLPYFRPELEAYWIGATGIQKNGKTIYDRCGIAKYWCMAGPTVSIYSTSVGRNGNNYDRGHGKPDDNITATYTPSYNGTSAAAPNVTASLALVMSRYPYLGTTEARDILFTTAEHMSGGSKDVPDTTFGWGRPNLKLAMEGPAQFLGKFEAILPENTSDTWSNPISDVALENRKLEEAAEVADWEKKKVSEGTVNGIPDDYAKSLEPQFIARIPAAIELVRKLMVANQSPYTGYGKAYANVTADLVANEILSLYGETIDWYKMEPDPREFMTFVASALPAPAELVATIAATSADIKRAEFTAMENRVIHIRGKTDDDYLGSLVKGGGGTLRLTGNSTYRGDTLINGGLLAVDGSIVSRTIINDGGTLGGVGTVGAILAKAGGTVSPGNSIGTLTAVGDSVFEKGSRLAIEIDGSGRSDRLAIDGKATLLGGVLQITAEGEASLLATLKTAAANDSAYRFLTATDGVSGTFDTTSLPYTFFAADLVYGKNDITFGIEQLTFATAGKSFNARGTATGIESLAGGNPLYDMVIASTSADEADTLFRLASGDIHASLKGAVVEDDRLASEATLDRVRGLFDETASQTQGGATGEASFWSAGYGALSDRGGDGNASGLDSSLGGFLIGGDGVVFDAWRIGFTGGYGTGSLDGQTASAAIDSYRFGVYGGTKLEVTTLAFGALYGRHDIETKRTVPDGGAHGDYSANSIQLYGEAAQAFDIGPAVVEPYTGLAYTHLSTEGFTETQGGLYSLSGERSADDFTVTTLGLRAAYDLPLDTVKARIFGGAGWRHTFGNVTPEARLAFAGGDTFTNKGLPLARNALSLEAGLDIGLTQDASLAVSYNGQIARDAVQHSVEASFNLKF